MKLASDMPSFANFQSTGNFSGVEAAIAYLSASDETKALVDQLPDPVTEKQIKELERKHRELEEEKQLLASRSQKLPMKTFFGSNARQTT